jgi:hypothetical protein
MSPPVVFGRRQRQLAISTRQLVIINDNYKMQPGIRKGKRGDAAPYAGAYLQRLCAIKTARRDTAPTVSNPLSFN